MKMRKRMSTISVTPSNDANLQAIFDGERLERESLVLWRRPLMTLKYGFLEILMLLINLGRRLLDRRIVSSLLIGIIIYYVPGPHAAYLNFLYQNLSFVIYWLGLGLLSSMGFGTGLHTFLLYLGPHIAAVTLAAYECQTLDFPAPPYPDLKICPQEPYVHEMPNMWSILTKVRIEATLWGVGTALGELPPYFMARTARLSGKSQEMEQLQDRSSNSKALNLFDKCKILVERVVLRIGFFGILLCASVPNPLFDLAGVACGHFLVPFWKFFVATLIGKAIVKTTLQQVLVIVAFSEDLVGKLIQLLGRVPLIGSKMQKPIEKVLSSTKQRMHRTTNNNDSSFTALSLMANAFQMISLAIVGYFGVSLVNALAQRHCNRLQLQKRQQNPADEQIELAMRELNDNDNLNEIKQLGGEYDEETKV